MVIQKCHNSITIVFHIGVCMQGVMAYWCTRLHVYMGTQGYDKGITCRLCIYGILTGLIVDVIWYSHMKCMPAQVSTFGPLL